MMTTPAPLDSLAQQIARQQTELEALRQEYQTRQARLAELTHRKQELAAQLQQVETDIEAVTEGSAPRPAAPASPAQAPSRPLLGEVLVEILREAQGPQTASQLAAELVRRNFPTSSKNLANLVQNRLGDLVEKGVLRRATGQPGVVLARSRTGPKTPAAGVVPTSKQDSKSEPASSKVAAPARPTGRRKVPLRTILTELLSKSERPMSARELAEQVLATGYQTKSKKFVDVLWVMLGQMSNAENVPGQGYRLKKRPKSGR